MLSVETNTRRIKARLLAEGWKHAGGAKHDKYEHPDKPGRAVIVPRRKAQKMGTARSIAKAAGWL